VIPEGLPLIRSIKFYTTTYLGTIKGTGNSSVLIPLARGWKKELQFLTAVKIFLATTAFTTIIESRCDF